MLLPNVNFTLSFHLFQLVRTLCLIRSAKSGPTIDAVLFLLFFNFVKRPAENATLMEEDHKW